LSIYRPEGTVTGQTAGSLGTRPVEGSFWTVTKSRFAILLAVLGGAIAEERLMADDWRSEIEERLKAVEERLRIRREALLAQAKSLDAMSARLDLLEKQVEVLQSQRDQ
jgi:hypothetical protein